MGVGKAVGKAFKWIFKHSEEIGNIADVGIKVSSQISENKRSRRLEDEVTQSVLASAEEYEEASAALSEIENDIKKLERLFETFENKVTATQENCDKLSADVKSLQDELGITIHSLREQLDLYQRKTNRRLIAMGVFAIVGMVTAILLAIIV